MSEASAASVKALVFDVFGTVVDWRSSVIRQCRELGLSARADVDWGQFVDEWRRDGYYGAIERVRRGELPFMTTDELHRRYLDELLPRFGIERVEPSIREALVLAWHRLDPWADVVAGLSRLKQSFVISTLSNGNLSLLIDLARHGGLPWDCVLSADLIGHFKPDPESYLSAARLLNVERGELMLVASHKADLRAAMAVGLRTAFILRPEEFGPTSVVDRSPDPGFDIVADGFETLATAMGC